MKHAFAALLVLALIATSAARAADAVTLAAQQENEERYKRLVAMVEELQAAQLTLHKQFSTLATEMSKLRDEVARVSNNTSTQDAIRKLNDQILKVDETRASDNRRIQEALEALRKALRDLPSAPPPRPRVETPVVNANGGANTGGTTRPGGTPAVEDGFEYTVQRGDSLALIVQRCRQEKIMVTQQMVRDANPNVDWNRLQIGKKIFIPKPK